MLSPLKSPNNGSPFLFTPRGWLDMCLVDLTSNTQKLTFIVLTL